MLFFVFFALIKSFTQNDGSQIKLQLSASFYMYECFVFNLKESGVVITDDDKYPMYFTVVATTVASCSANAQAAFNLGKGICFRFHLVCVCDCRAETIGAIMNCSPAYTQTKEEDGTGGPHRIHYLSARNNVGNEYDLGLQCFAGEKADLELKQCNFSMNQCTAPKEEHIGIVYLSSFYSDIY